MDFVSLLEKLNKRDESESREMWKSMSRVTDTILMQHRLYQSAKKSLEIQQQKIAILKENHSNSQNAREVERIQKSNVESREKLEQLREKREKLLQEHAELCQEHGAQETSLQAAEGEKAKVEEAVSAYKQKVEKQFSHTNDLRRDLDAVINTFNEKSTEEIKLKKKLERMDRKRIHFDLPKRTEEEEKKEKMPTRIQGARSTERMPMPKPQDRKMSYAGPALIDFVKMDQSTKKFSNHKGAITQLTFSNTSHFLATGSEDQVVNVYNYNNYSLLSTITDSKNTIVSLKFSESDKHLLAASWRGIARFYDVNNEFKLEADVNVREHLLDANFLTENKFAAAPEDQTIKIYEIGKTLPLQTLKLPNSANKIITIYGDSMVTAGCKDGHVRGIDIRSNQITFDIAPHKIKILDMETDNLNQIYTIAKDGKICTIDTRARSVINTFKYPWKYDSDYIQFYVQNEESVLVGCPKGYIHELDLVQNKEINQFKAHDSPVKSIAKKTGILATGDSKGLVKLWMR